MNPSWFVKPKLSFNLFTVVLVSGCIFASHLNCSSSQKANDELLKLIYSVVPGFKGEDLVCYVATQYDCSLCTASIQTWEEDVRNHSTLLQAGIIYSEQGNQSMKTVIKNLNLPEGILWNTTSEVELFEFLAKHYASISSPIVIHISNEQILFVKSANLDSWDKSK